MAIEEEAKGGELPLARTSRRKIQEDLPAALSYLERHGASDLVDMITGGTD